MVLPTTGKLSRLSVPVGRRTGGSGKGGEDSFRLSGERVGAVPGQRKLSPRGGLAEAIILMTY